MDNLLTGLTFDWPADFRSGFTAIVGRPNAGKSTLVNAMVGEKIAITANQPETTRKVIRGIVNRETAQLILVDTPGLHRPRTLLGERLNDLVHESLADVDCVAMCLPADEAIGPGDQFLLGLVKKAKVPIVAIVTKIDKISKEKLAQKLLAVSEFADFVEVIPVSAVRGEQVTLLVDLLAKQMPFSPPLYPQDAVTDESLEARVAELIREASLEGVRDELPHSIAVVIEEMETQLQREDDSRPPLTQIHATVYVERDSQKGIVIGKGGVRLREVGKRARLEIENILGTRVYLDLRVKVAKDWQRNPKLLGRMGF